MTNKDAPLVSIMLANYNGAHTLAPTIRTVLQQSYTDFELIVVDNVSDDDSRQVVESFNDSRVKFVSCDEHLSMAANWSRAAKLGTREYVTMIHADDAWHRDFLDKMLQRLQADSEASAVVCNAGWIDQKGRSFKLPVYNEKNRREAQPMTRDNIQELLVQMYVRPCAWLARRELFEQYEFSEEFYYGADWDFWLQVFEREKVLNEPRTLCDYRMHPSSRTFSDRQILLRLQEETTIITRAAQRHPEIFAPQIYKKALHRVMLRHDKCIVELVVSRRFVLAKKMVLQGVESQGIVGILYGVFSALIDPDLIYYVGAKIKHKVSPGPSNKELAVRG